jgi:hypothetical protein
MLCIETVVYVNANLERLFLGSALPSMEIPCQLVWRVILTLAWTAPVSITMLAIGMLLNFIWIGVSNLYLERSYFNSKRVDGRIRYANGGRDYGESDGQGRGLHFLKKAPGIIGVNSF